MGLVIKTAMPRWTTILKGSLTWPREVGPQSEGTILVFAGDRQEDEVDGLELVDDASILLV